MRRLEFDVQSTKDCRVEVVQEVVGVVGEIRCESVRD